jgi:hypothetical protein
VNRRQFILGGSGLAVAGAIPPVEAQSKPEDSMMTRTSIHRIEADGLKVFYREAGASDRPVVLLLHGFPTSSFQFRELIPRLADRYRVIAPDLPGFGFTEVPDGRHYRYSFDALGQTMLAFTDKLNLKRYALYVFDYGAPTGRQYGDPVGPVSRLCEQRETLPGVPGLFPEEQASAARDLGQE